MIEVLCSVSVFMILFFIAFKMQIDTLRIKKYNERINNYTYAVQYVKDSIIYNLTYDNVLDIFYDNMKYINLKDYTENIDQEKEILKLLSDKIPEKEYIEISVEPGEVLKIKLKLKANIYGIQREEECEFYKGNFER